jgi:hypothetical protein
MARGNDGTRALTPTDVDEAIVRLRNAFYNTV